MRKFLLALIFVTLASTVSAEDRCVEFAGILSDIASARDLGMPLSYVSRLVVEGSDPRMVGEALRLVEAVYGNLKDFTPAEVWGLALKSCRDSSI